MAAGASALVAPRLGRTTTMPTSGIITTKEDVQAFADSCVALRSLWRHFQILFQGTDLKRDLLQTTLHAVTNFLA
jgi:hypothetical protein